MENLRGHAGEFLALHLPIMKIIGEDSTEYLVHDGREESMGCGAVIILNGLRREQESRSTGGGSGRSGQAG